MMRLYAQATSHTTKYTALKSHCSQQRLPPPNANHPVLNVGGTADSRQAETAVYQAAGHTSTELLGCVLATPASAYMLNSESWEDATYILPRLRRTKGGNGYPQFFNILTLFTDGSSSSENYASPATDNRQAQPIIYTLNDPVNRDNSLRLRMLAGISLS